MSLTEPTATAHPPRRYPLHGVAFGVFDRFHAGHEDFLGQASSAFERLTIVVARDSMAARFKGRAPWQDELSRLEALRSRGYDAVLGDQEPGAYSALHEIKPDAIVIGYDQESLARDIMDRMRNGLVPSAGVVVMSSRDPSVHTSTLYPRTKIEAL